MFRKQAAVAVFVALVSASGQAAADEFLLEFDGPVTQDDTALMQSLRLKRIEEFEHDTRRFIVMQARDDASIEAYVRALKLEPVRMMAIRLDWQKLSMGGLSREQSLALLSEVSCAFCAGR